MSKTTNVKIKCQECGQENELPIWLSMNAQVDTDAFAQMLSGTLFTFECCGCGKKGHLNHDMVFHDVVHRVILHYVVSEQAEKMAQESIRKMLSETSEKALPSDYTIRIVKSQNALREKALLFHHGLDDRVMEVLKGISVSNIFRDHPDADIKEVLFLTNSGKWHLQMLGSKPMSAEIPMVRYDEIRRKMGESIEETPIKNYTVDALWALDVVRGYQEKHGIVPQG